MTHPATVQCTPANLPAGVERARVLVVDDNRINRHLLLALLERGGIRQVEQAADGNEGMERLESFKPDLVLLDLMMPHLDGFEMCRRMRADPRWKRLPVLIQSSLNRAEDRARAFAAGATDYVTKPINAVELLARVHIHIQKRCLLHDLEQYHARSQRELALARNMQERLMPSPARLATLRAACGLAIDAHFAPSSELGGDFWGIKRLPDGRTGVYLVDFSGHGVGAALNTFRLHAICQQLAPVCADPVEFLAAVNTRLCALLPSGQFATMLTGCVDPAAGVFHYASAGATAPMVWAPGDAEPLMGDGTGLPLGLLAGTRHESRSLPLPPGGRLFLYSDAAIEIPQGDGVLDEAGLLAMVRRRAGETDGARLLDGLLDELRATGPIDDDLTALLITRER
ncbi:PP2C family protein-serine/threonine phosphatase [Azospirillum agricola]|uniref:PP2C family protein-serine/threonine phosphatase n=1 Tax=Azospirillum agricola TaxID=1720247 RepID=UPI000A0F3558|nr:fused response regulator/phosphatase [Azospirillum agricola]SMH54380.1 Response regulator receiver domain-containing protein [Azospirillum lipoferum]